MATPNTHYGPVKISEMLRGCKELFFIGIGGVNMSSLAELSKKRGYRVSGSDHTATSITARLEDTGIRVFLTHAAENLGSSDAVIYTVAVSPDNPEYREALRRGLPLISRADYLGYMMTGYDRRIGISGMHGKSTTTSMCAQIFLEAGADPTVASGAALPAIGGYYRIGGKENFIFEACEYMDSFLDFHPTTAVILNIEMDHVDYFLSMDQIRNSYRAFADKVLNEENGIVVYNSDNREVVRTLEGFPGKTVTFGRTGNPDFCAVDCEFLRGSASFRILAYGKELCKVSLHVPGEHHIMNALASAAVAFLSGISGEKIKEGLEHFSGAERRMEFKGEVQGASVYDDYGHHPSEVRTTLSGARAMGFRRLYCLFQPHTYSRTKALFDEFVSAFDAVDEVFLLDIYAAREFNTLGVSSALLAERIGEKAHYCPSFRDAAECIREKLSPGDGLVVMGAGNVYDIFPLLGLPGNTV